jgi:WD40 repeat protein
VRPPDPPEPPPKQKDPLKVVPPPVKIDDPKPLPPSPLGRIVPVKVTGMTGLTVSADARFLALTNKIGVEVWDTAAGKQLAPVADPCLFQRHVLLTPDGRFVLHAIGNRSDAVRVSDAVTGKELAIFKHGGTLPFHQPLSLSPDGKSVAIFNTNAISVWELPDGQRRNVVPKSDVHFYGGVFLPDGLRIRTLGDRLRARERVTQLWDVATGKLLETTVVSRASDGWLSALSPDGRFYAFAPTDAPVLTLVDVTAPDRALPLSGKVKKDPDPRIAFSPDGRYLATLGKNGKALLWDMERGDLAAEWPVGHARNNWLFLAFAGNGKTLAAMGKDGVVLLDIGQAVAGR